ncbi:FAD-binding oxidoreductase [Georgenia sp. SYP-B2076]|uniref:FAD-binding oxidoreductase n=1 Tax=Georgenia sp. SYP-B2076 TaxID=2495881 RepID=UPI001F0CCC18|nr:FAD-linked oxidase C-terminal domain-containing protein [Georgenia sp. SYP-B2076]
MTNILDAPARPTTALLDALAEIVGPGELLTGPDTEPFRRDRSDGTPSGSPAAVVLPTSTEQVAAVVAVAAAHGIAIVPQGARTGLAGGANPGDGDLVVSTSRMTRILAVDAADRTATVEAGVLTIDVDRAAAGVGLFYPPDPASVAISTIGGNVATNAGGMRCVKYGVTGDFVRRLTVVLADGRIARTGHLTTKGVTGLDLTSLLVGSEGTLGIITEVTVALLPRPGSASGVLAAFPSTTAVLAAADEIALSSRRPSVLEYLDAASVAAIKAHDPAWFLPADAEAVLLVQSDEQGRAVVDVEEYAAIAEQHGATLVEVAHYAEALDRLMSARRLLHPALRELHGAILNEDVAVPRSQLSALLRGIEALADELGVTVATGGHLGDGNLHPSICYDPSDPAAEAAAVRAHGRIIELAVALGGTLSGEHGIGVLKRDHVGAELGDVVVGLQQQVKRALDPRGLLNPGKKL